MTENETVPSFASVFVWPALLPMVQRRVFGSDYVRLGPFLTVGVWLYSTGAVLGRAYSDRIETLATLFVNEPGREANACRRIATDARERVARYGSEPSSFYEYLMKTECEDKLGWPVDASNRTFNQKLHIERATSFEVLFFLEGIGFGATYPDLTEQMWDQTYLSIDEQSWAEARADGLDIPETFTPVTLQERERVILQQVAEYASDYYPHLIERLRPSSTRISE